MNKCCLLVKLDQDGDINLVLTGYKGALPRWITEWADTQPTSTIGISGRPSLDEGTITILDPNSIKKFISAVENESEDYPDKRLFLEYELISPNFLYFSNVVVAFGDIKSAKELKMFFQKLPERPSNVNVDQFNQAKEAVQTLREEQGQLEKDVERFDKFIESYRTQYRRKGTEAAISAKRIFFEQSNLITQQLLPLESRS